MTRSSAELSREFSAAAAEFANLIRGLNEEQWNATTEAEGWSVGTVAHHVAQSLEITWGMTDLMLSDNVPPVTFDDINAANAAHAAEFANPDQAETVALMEQATPVVAEGIAALDDAALDHAALVQAFGDDPLPVRAWIENVVIGHISMHRPSIEAAVNQ